MGDLLRALLAPQRIAIVGLSSDPSKHGNRVLANLRRLGWAGTVWGVNPRGRSADGVETVPSVRDLPDRPDVLVCAVPGPAMPGVLDDAGVRGADVVIVFGGGFAETGAAGRDAQRDLVTAARRAGVRMLGPNSGGVVHADSGLALSFLTWLDRPVAQVRGGPVALVTQSGGTGSYVHSLAAAAGGGLAASISTGNEADVGMAEVIAGLARRADVRAIALVLETVRDGPGFMAAVRAASAAGTPVVACRLGTSARGQHLMRSHTGALAGPGRVLDGVCDALGITVVDTPGELVEVAGALAAARAPAGPRVGIVTHSGGTAILLSDLAARHGLDLPPVPPDLAQRLAPLLDHGTAANPADLGGIIGGPHRFAEVVGHFQASGAYDAVLAVTTPHPPAHTADRASSLLALGDHPTPLLHLWMAGDLGDDGLAALRAGGAAVTVDPRAAVTALAGLARRHTLAGAPPDDATGTASAGTAPPAQAPAPADAASPARASAPAPGATWPAAPAPTEHGAKQVLRAWGLPVVAGAHAGTPDDAVAAAERLGYPVVVKVSSPDIAHKSDLGGIRVDLRTAAEVARAAEDVCRAAAAGAPGATVDGVLVEQFAPGLELLVGVVDDATFGPTALLGLGGVDVEAHARAVAAPVPTDTAAAHRLIARLDAPALHVPGRDRPAPDLDALAGIITRLGAGVRAAGGALAEAEVNPLTWGSRGWLAVDALLRPAPGGR